MYRLAVATAGLALVAATACGGGDAKSDGPRRSVDVTMSDIKFEPSALSVAKGETVTFRFANRGQIPHDAYVGDAKAQADHEREMREGKSHGHGDDAVTVDPGKSGELTHTFSDAGTFEVGCHQPGHYGAGMKIVVTVA